MCLWAALRNPQEAVRYKDLQLGEKSSLKSIDLNTVSLLMLVKTIRDDEVAQGKCVYEDQRKVGHKCFHGT